MHAITTTKSSNRFDIHPTLRSPQILRVQHGKFVQVFLLDDEWEIIIHLYTHKGSSKVAIQENCYKVATRWYRTPISPPQILPIIDMVEMWEIRRYYASHLVGL